MANETATQSLSPGEVIIRAIGVASLLGLALLWFSVPILGTSLIYPAILTPIVLVILWVGAKIEIWLRSRTS